METFVAEMSVPETAHGDAQSSSTPSLSSSSSDRFRFLRSLRDLLFGRRRQGRGRDVAAVPRVKSSRSLDDELESRASIDSDGSRLPSAAGSSKPATTSAHLK